MTGFLVGPSDLRVRATHTPVVILDATVELAKPARDGDHRSAPGLAGWAEGGISATTLGLALRALGREDVAIYDGSLEEWSADPALPLDPGRTLPPGRDLALPVDREPARPPGRDLALPHGGEPALPLDLGRAG